MSIEDDWIRLTQARIANLNGCTSLPERFYAACAYADECKTFVENNWESVCMMMESLRNGDGG